MKSMPQFQRSEIILYSFGKFCCILRDSDVLNVTCVAVVHRYHPPGGVCQRIYHVASHEDVQHLCRKKGNAQSRVIVLSFVCQLSLLFCSLFEILANTPMESNGQGWGAWSWSKCVEANLNFCGSLIVAILSGSEFQSITVLGKKKYL